MKFTTSRKSGALIFFAAVAVSATAGAQSGNEHHRHAHPTSGPPVASAAAPAAIPSLKILMPEAGDLVGNQLALVFETPANLSGMTMSAPVVGVHLHIQYDDTALMPTLQQLIRLGKDRYLYLFDLPVAPGSKTLRVYWSDAQHKTIESTIQSVTVTVASEPPR